jgi:hypothetical protein
MEHENLFSYAHPHFYEPIGRIALLPEYTNRLKGLLPDDWQVSRWDVWVGATPQNAASRPQGFKIHVSSTPRHALRTLDVVVPELVSRGIGFKIAGDPRLLSLLISKRTGRGGAGKFMTIYPRDTDTFRELIEALHVRTRGEDLAGPYILSDRRYRDSKVLYYRYGGFEPRSVLTPEGTRTSVIRDPDGRDVPDERTPFFRLPEWVEDPFGGAQALEYRGEPILNERYRVDSVIVFSNAGGVYRGTDLRTDRPVIIKEARPYAHFWSSGPVTVDAVAILEREFRILERLNPLGVVPEPIDLFSEWEHTFLVESVLPGRTFQQFWSHDDNILGPFIRREGRVERFVPHFREIAARVIDTVVRIHERGVILGDLSPNNVFIDPETHSLGLIDFESAFITGQGEEFSEISRAWGTAGYVDTKKREERGRLSVEDDAYAVGMLLYSAVCPVQNFFSLNPSARECFIDRFVELGVPVQVKQVIVALLEGDMAGAKRILESWDALAPAEEPAGGVLAVL